MWRSIAGARFVGPRVRPTSTAPICVLIPRAVVPHAQRSRWQRQSRNPSGTDGSQTPRWRKTDSNCRSPLRRGAFLNRLLPPLQPAKPVETEVFDPRGTDGSNPSSSSGESLSTGGLTDSYAQGGAARGNCLLAKVAAEAKQLREEALGCRTHPRLVDEALGRHIDRTSFAPRGVWTYSEARRRVGSAGSGIW